MSYGESTLKKFKGSTRVIIFEVETDFSELPDIQKIKTYTNPIQPNLTRVSGATLSMP